MEESREFIPRLLRTAGLDPAAFREVASDRESTGQAGLVVLLAGLCTALGALLAGRAGLGVLPEAVVRSLIGWLVWSWFTYAVGVLLFQGSARYGSLLRAIGFAHGPLMLRLLRFIPGFGTPLWQLVRLWALFASFVAVREALGLSTGRALATVLIAWLVQAAVFSALSGLIGSFEFPLP